MNNPPTSSVGFAVLLHHVRVGRLWTIHRLRRWDSRLFVQSRATASASSTYPSYVAANAINGDHVGTGGFPRL